MNNERRSERSRKIAKRITILCIIANLPLLFFILFGPKEGMEELAIIVPWFLTGAVHLFLFIPAFLFALNSRKHLANIWIYAYFIIFFGFHIIFLAHINGLDTQLHKKLITVVNPDQAEFHQLLSDLRYIPSDDKTESIEELIQNGVDVNSMFPGDNMSAIQKAAYGGNTRIIRLLLEKGAPVDEFLDRSTTALGWAVQQNHTEAACLLLEKGADPNRGVSGYSFLNTSVKNKNPDLVAALLKSGANPNTRIFRQERPLMFAAMNGYEEILELLLEGGADPDFQLPDGRTALVVAVSMGHAGCVDLLLNANAKLTGTGARGASLLSLAATCGNPEIAERIHKAIQADTHSYGDAESSFRNRYLDLNRALTENRLEDFKKMLRIGIFADSTYKKGNTLLLGICMKSLRLNRLNAADIVQILVENGANINKPTIDETTPLMHAARTGQIAIVKLLINNGADINVKNKYGHDALYYAGKQQEIVDTLLSAGAEKAEQKKM